MSYSKKSDHDMDTTMNQTTTAKTEERIANNVMPLVIKQILNCNDERFQQFGFPAQIIKLVAIIKHSEVLSTRVNYTIADHTGEMKAVLWLSIENGEIENMPNVVEGKYAEIFGTYKYKDDERVVMILKMTPVKDCNVITNHLLRAIHNRFWCEAESNNMLTDIKINNPGAQLVTSMNLVDDNMATGSSVDGLSDIQKKVKKILSTDTTVLGMSRDVLYTHFNANQRPLINKALEFLCNEGHIYTTHDADHFRTLNIEV
ncbi:unnamed protein product [Phyllotreta striolata]|uniref:Replication protein A C-terminal domain-containing protein n=1 Tax=Phyllotreta striolata TaxID=444603 RepID=A0A9N9TGJ8_PHYSR|nr:unnamed protein product [Phyllotreta striolata]